MKQTFRALAITTVIVAVVSFCSIMLYWHTYAGEWFTFYPTHPQSGYYPSVQRSLLQVWFGINDTLWAPVVAVFAVVVAAQARRWGWLAALSTVGLLAILGPQLLYGLPLVNMGILANPVSAILLGWPSGEYAVEAILYTATLVFAVIELRAQSGAATSASISPAPQL